ncbi:MAG: LON peptidase substrate-binding domain-containing protein [Anaerolineae bacterium]
MPTELLPLFPLNAVLFPSMVLPLHIFEDRYKLMVNNCLAQDRPFGVVLIYAGSEVGGPAIPHPVGTVARIARWEWLPDGRMNILTVGERRFRIVDFAKPELPYLEGLVEYWDDEPDERADLSALVDRVRHTFIDYLTLIMSLADQALPINQLQLPDDVTMLSYHIASNLQIEMSERQELLEEPSAVARLRRELALLRREGSFLQRLISLQGSIQDEDLPWGGVLYTN